MKRRQLVADVWTDEKLKEHFKTMYEQVSEFGVQARGKKELLLFYEGKPLTFKQSSLAHCYECMGYYEGMGSDKDCRNQACPKYQYMPYNASKKKAKKQNGEEKPKVKKVLSEEHKKKMLAGRRRTK